MPLDYSVHDLGTPLAGNLPPAPHWPRAGGEKALAENTASADIVISAPSVIIASADIKLRVDIRHKTDSGSLDAAASPEVIEAGVPFFRFLAPGTYVLKTAAWS